MKEDLYLELFEKLLDNDMLDLDNYSNDLETIKSDFLELCKAQFDNIIFLQGHIIE